MARKNNEFWINGIIEYVKNKKVVINKKRLILVFVKLLRELKDKIHVEHYHFFFEGKFGFEMRFEIKKGTYTIAKRIIEKFLKEREFKFKIRRYYGEERQFYPAWETVKRFFEESCDFSIKYNFDKRKWRCMSKEQKSHFHIGKLVHTFCNQMGLNAMKETMLKIDDLNFRLKISRYMGDY